MPYRLNESTGYIDYDQVTLQLNSLIYLQIPLIYV